jgi:hypothetical protein
MLEYWARAVARTAMAAGKRAQAEAVGKQALAVVAPGRRAQVVGKPVLAGRLVQAAAAGKQAPAGRRALVVRAGKPVEMVEKPIPAAAEKPVLVAGKQALAVAAGKRVLAAAGVEKPTPAQVVGKSAQVGLRQVEVSAVATKLHRNPPALVSGRTVGVAAPARQTEFPIRLGTWPVLVDWLP